MKKWILILLLIKCFNLSGNDSVLTFNLQQTIDLAQKQSPDIVVARHQFRSSYWNYCFYKANYLPSLTLTSSPNFNQRINPITLPDGTTQFIQQNQLTSDVTFTINQNIPLTGGRVFVQSGLQRLDALYKNTFEYKSNAFTIGYSQSLFGYNELKWNKKIEPLKFEEAKRRYVENLELVAARAVLMFFNLAKAQTNLEIAQTNFTNADTLYVFAQGRYNIGTITENEMLQLEVSKLTEESNQLEAQMQLDDAMENLRAFLGIKEISPIEVVIQSDISLKFIDVSRALEYAIANGRDIVNMERRIQESESSVARSKAMTGFKADLFMEFGLAGTGSDIETSFRNPSNQQLVQLGISLPILDWGRGKGQVQVAKSSRDMVHAQVEQDRISFEMNIVKSVKQFNLQSHQLNVAAKVDNTAERRNEVARRLFLLGKSTILDLNASITEKDAAKRNYINTLHTYWTLYYMMRSITLFDLEKNIPITEDYRLLVR